MENKDKTTNKEHLEVSHRINNLIPKEAISHLGWKVLSPENKDKAVALFNRHDDAIHFAVMKWGMYSEWKVECCDKRIPLYCY